MDLIQAEPNPFGGVVVDPGALDGDAERFRKQLARSLEAWRSKGYKVVWLEVPISRAALVPVAVDAGFTYHHADASNVLLTLRLEPGSFIPPYATHYVGVGGVVVNEANELLVVSERYKEWNPGRKGFSFKLPGGALRRGEHVAEAAVREVYEETGIRTRFESLVCFRHWHGYRYGKSDIYFVCRLSPLSSEIVMQEEEIEACIWMPIDEVLGETTIGKFTRDIVRAAIDSAGISPSPMEGYSDAEKYEFMMPPLDYSV